MHRLLFSRVKDKVPIMQKSHVVYDIPCCEDCYVGETKNRLETREEGYQYNISIKNKSHSALCNHVLETKHTPRWNEVKIIYNMIAIKQTKNNMNKKTDTLFLSTIYNDVLGLESNSNESERLQPLRF